MIWGVELGLSGGMQGQSSHTQLRLTDCVVVLQRVKTLFRVLHTFKVSGQKMSLHKNAAEIIDEISESFLSSKSSVSTSSAPKRQDTGT